MRLQFDLTLIELLDLIGTGQVSQRKLDGVGAVVNQLFQYTRENMAALSAAAQQQIALLTAIDAETTRVADLVERDLQQIRGGVSADEAQNIISGMTKHLDQLRAIGKNPSDPVPGVPIPQVPDEGGTDTGGAGTGGTGTGSSGDAGTGTSTTGDTGTAGSTS